MRDPEVILEGQVGPQTSLDGQSTPLRIGKEGQLIVTQLHGKYAESCSRGNVFFGTSATGGIVILQSTTTGNFPTLWNPAGSSYTANLLRLSLTYITGTNAVGGLYWHITSNAGSAIGTAAPISGFTNVAPTCALLGASKASAMKWAPTTCAFTAAPSYLCGTGIALDAFVATGTYPPWTTIVDYDGMLQLNPGNALSLCTVNATSTATFTVTLFWEEAPV